MKGGVTYMDMDERKEALAFVAWLSKYKPFILKSLWELWKRSLAS